MIPLKMANVPRRVEPRIEAKAVVARSNPAIARGTGAARLDVEEVRTKWRARRAARKLSAHPRFHLAEHLSHGREPLAPGDLEAPQ